MLAEQKQLAQQCLAGAETDTLTFPQILALLGQGGFEGYAVDYRSDAATYYLASGEAIVLATHAIDTPVAALFDTIALSAAIGEAQALIPGYTYAGFCRKAKAAGCAGYQVSLTGRRAVYFGRGCETHTEYFPD